MPAKRNKKEEVKRGQAPLICRCVCPYCDVELIVAESPFCDVCKKSFGRCSKCGAVILDAKAVKCASCGSPLG